ncbi:hypothetical protein EWB00_001271, partial [Schistosoma japonicum]
GVWDDKYVRESYITSKMRLSYQRSTAPNPNVTLLPQKSAARIRATVRATEEETSGVLCIGGQTTARFQHATRAERMQEQVPHREKGAIKRCTVPASLTSQHGGKIGSNV